MNERGGDNDGIDIICETNVIMFFGSVFKSKNICLTDKQLG